MPFDKNAPVASFASLDRAGRALFALSKIHFVYHNTPRELFQNFGIWVTLEALVYSADTTNEEGRFDAAHAGLDRIRDFLEDLGLFDDQLAAELDGARTYFSLERRYMEGVLSVPEIRQAASLRSFDFRLLHRLLWRLQGWPYEEATFRGFAALEEVIEYDDDAASIEKDRKAGTFNVVCALSGHGHMALVQYCEDLRRGVESSMVLLGTRFIAVVEVLYALSPGTMLAGLLDRASEPRPPRS